jgi:hypothetical protein
MTTEEHLGRVKHQGSETHQFYDCEYDKYLECKASEGLQNSPLRTVSPAIANEEKKARMLQYSDVRAGK